LSRKSKTRRNFLHPAWILLILMTAFCVQKPAEVKMTAPPVDPHAPYNAMGRQGMVVAAHPLAVEAGLSVLKSGGNAVDAAVAVSFALNAAEPFASGLGGGGFMLLYLAGENKVTAVNYREKAPRLAGPNMFEEKGKDRDEWRSMSGLAVGVPGMLAGWNLALKKYGTKTLAELVKPAVEIAEKGMAVSKNYCAINKEEYERLLKNAGEGSCYLNNGLPYEPGERLHNPDLARTLRRIAEKGIEEFYRGEIAQKIVEAVAARGGVMALDDLASYEAVEIAPLKGSYQGHPLYTIPPPGSGAYLIELLNIIESWPVKSWGHNSPVYIHHLSEALGFVFADRDFYLGDPDFVSIPLDGLLSKPYASRIAGAVRPDRVLDSYPPGIFGKKDGAPGNTTHLCVVDKDGNIAALTQSINDFFGSGIVPEGTGFLLNDHMKDFYPLPGSPNSPGPLRRPASSMAPVIVFKDGKPFLSLGSPGGVRIFPSLAQIIVNIVDFGMSLDEAIEAPRFFFAPSKDGAAEITVESRIPESILKRLEGIGHKIAIKDAYDRFFGGAQGILIDRNRRVIYGGADSRRDGTGKGY